MSEQRPISLAIKDSRTMLRRQLLHLRRYPSMTVLLVGIPVLLLLLFVYVFGGTLGAGLTAGATGVAGGTGTSGAGGRAAYLDYVTPALIVMAAASAAQGTAISVAMDVTSGIVARFRSMAISPGSVLTGHVLSAVIQSLLCMGTLLLVAVALGLRPGAGLRDWVLLLGILTLTALALTWLSVALGLVSKSVETASNLPMFLIFLPFLGSGFVPVESMPAGLAWFAEHQPFTPIIDTVRGLLAGQPVPSSTAWLAVAWCLAIALLGYVWSRRLYATRAVTPLVS
jgi:ABC-2 type transport system permease protein